MGLFVVEAAEDVVNGVVGFFDVVHGAVFEAGGKTVVVVAVEVVPGGIAGFAGAVKAVSGSDAGVDGRVVVEVFAVGDGGFADFAHGLVDFSDGVGRFLINHAVGGGSVKEGAHHAEVLEGVEVGGMVAGGLGLCR